MDFSNHLLLKWYFDHGMKNEVFQNNLKLRTMVFIDYILKGLSIFIFSVV